MSTCDCTEFPFTPDPPCYEECTGKAINRADALTLRTIFSISDNLAQKIKNLPGSYVTLQDFKDNLEPGEGAILDNTFSNLSSNPRAIAWIKANLG